MRRAAILKADKIFVEKELKIVSKEGGIETELFNLTGSGTVSSGKSKHQQTTAETGLVMKSANGHRWKKQISDTGQDVNTDLGL